MSDPKIPIYLTAQSAYVWSVDDARTLRVQHHITGILVGTLPSISQQNVFLGIPLWLMPEEVVVLVDAGIATLVDDPHALRLPTAKEITLETHTFLHSIAEQQRTSVKQEEARRQQAKSFPMTDAQRAKRAQRLREKSSKSKQSEETDVFDPTPEAPAPPPSSSSANTRPPPSSTPYSLYTPPTSTELPYYDSSQLTYHSIEDAKKAGVWSFPSNQEEVARVEVFRALWQRGYFMGGGIKFGGELLVYPGDPLRYHSHFVSTALSSPDWTISPMELVAWGRLGTATKKAHLICSWDEEVGEVDCYSLEWASF